MNTDINNEFNISTTASLVSKYKQAIMGVAALFIFYFHTHACYLMDIGPLGEWEVYIKRILFFGVDMFLLLSGMGVVFSLKKNNVVRFYINRLKRIYPPVILAAIVMMFVDKWSITVFFKRISGYSFFFEWFYSFLWFFTAILILYIVSPLLYKWLEKDGNRFIKVLLFFVFYMILVNAVDRKTSLDIWDYYGFTNRIPIYVFGMYLGFCIQSKKELDESCGISGLEVMLYLGMLIFGGFLAYVTSFEGQWLLVPNSNNFLPNILLGISCCFLIPVIINKCENTKGVISNITKVIKIILDFFGMISFEFYIVQEWICDKMLKVVVIDGRVNSFMFNVKMMVACVITALILRYISGYVVKGIEIFCLTLKKKNERYT